MAEPRRVVFFGRGCEAFVAVLKLAMHHWRTQRFVIALVLDRPTSQAARKLLAGHCKDAQVLEQTAANADELREFVAAFAPDLLISVLYPRRIRADVLELAPARINFHPSLLPRHRGCLTQFHSIWAADRKGGVTCHHMLPELDAGAIIYQASCDIDDDESALSLNGKLQVCFTAAFRAVFPGWLQSGTLPAGRPQVATPEDRRHFDTYNPAKLPFDGEIQPEWTHDEVDRYIRAMWFPPHRCATWRGAEVTTLEEYKALCA